MRAPELPEEESKEEKSGGCPPECAVCLIPFLPLVGGFQPIYDMITAPSTKKKLNYLMFGLGSYAVATYVGPLVYHASDPAPGFFARWELNDGVELPPGDSVGDYCSLHPKDCHDGETIIKFAYFYAEFAAAGAQFLTYNALKGIGKLSGHIYSMFCKPSTTSQSDTPLQDIVSHRGEDSQTQYQLMTGTTLK
jgi:hypothetical protein